MWPAEFVKVKLLASYADMIAARCKSGGKCCEEEKGCCGARRERSHVR